MCGEESLGRDLSIAVCKHVRNPFSQPSYRMCDLATAVCIWKSHCNVCTCNVHVSLSVLCVYVHYHFILTVDDGVVKGQYNQGQPVIERVCVSTWYP